MKGLESRLVIYLNPVSGVSGGEMEASRPGLLARVAIIGRLFEDGLTGSAWGVWASFLRQTLVGPQLAVSVQKQVQAHVFTLRQLTQADVPALAFLSRLLRMVMSFDIARLRPARR